MRVAIETYGCTLNQSDSDIISSLIEKSGHELSPISCADVIIINTCGVKKATEQKIIHRLSVLSAEGKRLIICGCLPKINPAALRRFQVSVLGPDQIDEIPQIIENATLRKNMEKERLPRNLTSPIARVPVAEGCLGACTFCATRSARGQLRSYSEDIILGWIREALAKGAKEIQLTAQDMGCYGMDNDSSLRSLLRRISEIEGEFRVRVGMMGPRFLDGVPKNIFESPKFYRFLHIPVQSADDGVLKDMARGYKICQVTDFINRMRERCRFTFETDLIAGYPTEDERAFERTMSFVREVKPDVINVSRFTPRPGTVAAKLKQLPNGCVKERTVKLSALCRKMEFECKKRYVGLVEEVLILENGKGHTMKGRTNTYKQVILPEGRAGFFIKARIERASTTSLFSVVDPNI